jgi:hypothetical protein
VTNPIATLIGTPDDDFNAIVAGNDWPANIANIGTLNWGVGETVQVLVNDDGTVSLHLADAAITDWADMSREQSCALIAALTRAVHLPHPIQPEG